MLNSHADSADFLPFKIVDRDLAKIWRNAVPLVSIRSLILKDDYQKSLDGESWDKELVSWEGHPEFEKGMFVARVIGDAMKPLILAGSYCLFKAANEESIDGKVVLVKHGKINDPHTGGDWAVRTIEVIEAVGEVEHKRINLVSENSYVPVVQIEPAVQSGLTFYGELVEVLAVDESRS